jgi:F-type H+-transporting ATPase subunit gamma
MASGKEIKQRIKSVKNTKKITKAMELVAASKMKRAVSRTMDARAYARYSSSILNSLPQNENTEEKKVTTEKKLIILISSNRGLCGAYNAQILRAVMTELRENPTVEYEFLTVGRKGDFAMRRIGKKVVANFDVGESVTFADALPIADYSMTQFDVGGYKSVSVFYTDFVSALTQHAKHIQLLPFDLGNTKQIDGTPNARTEEICFEPSYERVSVAVIKKVIRMQIYHMILESFASEQSSRMVAMKNASEAAGEMIDDLTLAFNKARQASITQEISEISAGMASVS